MNENLEEGFVKVRERYLVAADTGGTFTDVAVYDSKAEKLLYGKTLTDYGNLVDGVLAGLDATTASVNETRVFKHGTTHVINSFIQRVGANTALITTEGFRDTLEIARGNRPVPFALGYSRDAVLVPRPGRFEVAERIDSRGQVVTPLDEDGLVRIAEKLKCDGTEAIAVSFINAYANPVHEERTVALLRGLLPNVYVTCGSALTREWFEYERVSTAAANAFVGPRMKGYLDQFDAKLRARDFPGAFFMMGSNGGVLSIGRALEQPVALVESGPIGGCIGAALYADALGLDKLIAFDMGGTTAKCALVQHGQFDVQPIYYVGGYDYGFPLKTPVLDIVEVGAGGGSIAAVDRGGRLTVGPRSAGSEPGPVAFGRGGVEPTVTDANLALGRISSGSFMQGKLTLDAEASRRAIADLVALPLGYGTGGIARAAQGILDLATATMASAIKEITIERGHDARDFALFVFGGGGALFGSILARALRIPRVIVPPHPGNFSALGMLCAGARIDLARTIITEEGDMIAIIDGAFQGLQEEARATIHADLPDAPILFDRTLDMRYRGQKHNVRVPYGAGDTHDGLKARFAELYRERYGHANADLAIEIVGVRLGAEAEIPRPDISRLAEVGAPGTQPVPTSRPVWFPVPAGLVETAVYRRDTLPIGFAIEGPAVIEEFTSTTILQPGDHAHIGELGEIVIDCRS
jgi:N-methylhydantoinase A